MTPQHDRTADVLSNALGWSTITAVTESQSRIRSLVDSANVSRRSEERPLVSANELLRFPLDEVLVLPEGHYPIRARHIRYYVDRHFAPIEQARAGRTLSKVQTAIRHGPTAGAVKLSSLAATVKVADAEGRLPEATSAFREIAQAAKGKRRLPERMSAG